MVFKVNKTLSKPNSTVVVQINKPFEDILEIISFDDEIDGLTNQNKISREFAYSYDDKDWSRWIKVSDTNIISAIDITKSFYLKFKYLVVVNYNLSNIIINSVILNVKTKETVKEVPSPDRAFMFPTEQLFDFNKLGEAYVEIHNSMNHFLNLNYGIEVTYIRTEPDAGSTDVFLKEYSIKNSVEKCCLKVIVPGNKIPEPKHKYDEWGINFEDFEIHISKEYFETVFGIDKKPRVEDYMYIPVVNRLYYVYSMYLGRGINESANFYILSVKKYDENTSVTKTDEIEEFIESKTISGERIFKNQIEEEQADALNDMQTSTKTISSDIVRDEIHELMDIVDDPIINNGNRLMNSYYNMAGIPKDEVAIKYKKSIELPIDGSMGLSSLIKIQSSTAIRHTFSIINQSRLNQNLVKLEIDKSVADYLRLIEADSIHLGTDFYDISRIEDDTHIVIRSKTLIPTGLYRKARKVNLMTATGEVDFSATLYENSTLQLSFKNTITKFSGFDLDDDVWHGIMINVSNVHKYAGFYAWKLVEHGNTYPDRYSTRLENVVKKELIINEPLELKEAVAYITGSEMFMGNIRVFKKAVDFEVQSFILSKQIVDKPSMAFLIDDAALVLNVPNIGQGAVLVDQRARR